MVRNVEVEVVLLIVDEKEGKILKSKMMWREKKTKTTRKIINIRMLEDNYIQENEKKK